MHPGFYGWWKSRHHGGECGEGCAHEHAGHGEKLLAGLFFHLGGELLSLGFLFGGQRDGHRGILPGACVFVNNVPIYVELNKKSTNFGAAYPKSCIVGFKSCFC